MDNIYENSFSFFYSYLYFAYVFTPQDAYSGSKSAGIKIKFYENCSRNK